MRIGITLSLLIASLFTVSNAAASPEARGTDNGVITVTDLNKGSAGTPGQPGTGGSGGPNKTADRPVYSYWLIVYTGTDFCKQRRYTTDRAEARAYNSIVESRALQADGLRPLPSCPQADSTAPLPPTPGELAREFWDVRRLPKPTPKVVPDHAIVGKKVYLQIGGRPSTTFDVPNPIGTDIAIDATSRYVVDWGDGSPPTTTTSQGGPWPHGDVTHVYDTSAPAVTIRVTQQWSATWAAGDGAAGTLDDLRTAGELTIRVDQLQPVRNR